MFYYIYKFLAIKNIWSKHHSFYEKLFFNQMLCKKVINFHQKEFTL